ncbi:SagB/ThcOx family dehydrogenase [Desulfosudis oleivorans]|nr:SagB/ThcOx family dehydrogenase [Desulfosudis oleivorans]
MNRMLNHYHRITGYDRHAMVPHSLDWENQPSPCKIYQGLGGVDLADVSLLNDTLFSDVMESLTPAAAGRTMSLEALSRACLLANGPTGRSRQGDGWFYYRSAPSAGALYPNELYLVWPGAPDLEAGVYHVDVHNRRLTRLRRGGFAPFLRSACPAFGKAVRAVFVVSALFFRSAWKYRKRAYRYVLLDGGHLAESTRLALAAAGFSASVVYDFNDAGLNRLLGLDEKREGAIACIGINGPAIPETPGTQDVDNLPGNVLQAGRVSSREKIYPEIVKVHADSSACGPSAAVPRIGANDLGLAIESWQPVSGSGGLRAAPWKMGYAEAVVRRRSRRNFVPARLSAVQFSGLLESICRAYLSPDREHPAGACGTICTGFLCRNAEGLEPGFYLVDPEKRQIGRAGSGDLTVAMTDACLNQAWLKNAALHFVFMTNLEILDQDLGSRGYRHAMMSAGRLGHVLYLSATALGLGCCGIGAFYDREAEQILGLNPPSAMLYLVGVGPVPDRG